MKTISKIRGKYGLCLALLSIFLFAGSKALAAQVAPMVGDIAYGGVVVSYNDSTKTVLVLSLDEELGKRWEEARGWAKGYKSESYKDWRLPELSELLQIYEKQEEIDLELGRTSYPKLSRDYYWSSEEYGSYTAWYVRVGLAAMADTGKAPRYRTRAVRSFNLKTMSTVSPPREDDSKIQSSSAASGKVRNPRLRIR